MGQIKDKILVSNNVKLLDVRIDNGLKFDELSDMCSRFLSLEKRLTLFRNFIESQFLSNFHWYWYFTERRQTIKLTGFMKVLSEQCIYVSSFADLLNKVIR